MKKVEIFTIKPNKNYTIQDICTGRLMPWARDSRTIVKIVKQDLKGENILQAKVTGKNQNTRYLIMGKNIIKFINKYGNVLIHTARKPKQIYGKRRKEGGRGKGSKSGSTRSPQKHLRRTKCIPRGTKTLRA